MLLPLHGLLQARITRLSPLKRVFNTAANVLVCTGAALAHGTLAAPLSHATLPRAFGGPRQITAVFLATLVYLVLNSALVVGIIRRVAPATPWRTLLCDSESWALSLSDVCAGVVLALAWVASPVLIVFGLIPTLLLQRSVIHTHLVAASRHDPKTGLANPSWWRHEADRAVTRTRHGGEPVAVVVIDLDHFKTVNDRQGHLLGDAVLAAVADTLRVSVRPGDLVGRFGGDEFTVLLAGIDQDQAVAMAERLRERLASTVSQSLAAHDPGTPVTASLGVAIFGPSGVDLDQLLAAADSAMYRAKAVGGNCVQVAAGLPSRPSPLSPPSHFPDQTTAI